MSSRELSEWAVYEGIEPFGERRADYRAASICQIIAAAQGAKDTKLEDFLLSRSDPGPTLAPDIMRLAHSLGAKVVTREPL
jgi:hypothetical protein